VNQPCPLQAGGRAHADFAPEKFAELHFAEPDMRRDVGNRDATCEIRVDVRKGQRNAPVVPPRNRKAEASRPRLLEHQLLEQLFHRALRGIGRCVAYGDDRFQPRQHGLRVLRMQEGRSETAERIRPGDIPGQRVGDEVLRRAAAVGKSE